MSAEAPKNTAGMSNEQDPNLQISLQDRLKMVGEIFQPPQDPPTEQRIQNPQEKNLLESWSQAVSLLDRFKVSDKLLAYQQVAWNGKGIILNIRRRVGYQNPVVVGLELRGYGEPLDGYIAKSYTDGGYISGGYGDRHWIPATTEYEVMGERKVDEKHSIQITAERVDPLYWDTGFELYAYSSTYLDQPDPEVIMPAGEIFRDSKAREKWSVRPKNHHKGYFISKRLIACEEDLDEFLASDFQNRLANRMIPTQKRFLIGSMLKGEEIIEAELHKLVHETGKVFTDETKDKLEKDGFIFYRLRKGLVSEVAVQEGRVLLDLEASRSPDETLREYSDILSARIPGAKAIIGRTPSNIEVLKNYLSDKSHWDEFLRHQEPGTPFSIVSEVDELWKKGYDPNRRELEDLRINPYSDLEKNGFSIEPDAYGYFRPWCKRYMPLVVPA